MKYFRLTPEQILWQISYANIVMYMATIPVFEYKKENDGEAEPESNQQITDFGDDIQSLSNYINNRRNGGKH